MRLCRHDNEQWRSTLILFTAPSNSSTEAESTNDWEPEEFGDNCSFVFLACADEDVYALVRRLGEIGPAIYQSPKDGRLIFVRCLQSIFIQFF